MVTKDRRMMPISWYGQNGEIISLWRSQEDRLRSYHARKSGCKNGKNVADTPKIYPTPQLLTRCV